MALNPSTLLTQVEDAIEALLTGEHSSYAIGDRTVTRLDLNALFQQRAILQREVARQSSGGLFRVAKIFKPRT